MTAAGAATEGRAHMLRAYPVSKQWFRLLAERLDAVAVLYGVAAMTADADPHQKPVRVDHYRNGPYDMLLTLSGGRTIGLIRQGPALPTSRLRYGVKYASSSGHPGNVSPRLVRCEVQNWIDQLDLAEVRMKHQYNNLPYRTFQFNNWRLDVELDLKSPEDKERLGDTAVDLAGFSGGWSDVPAKRLKSKLEEKSSQVRKTKGHCVVAVTGRLEGFSVDDVQTALFGETVSTTYLHMSKTYSYLNPKQTGSGVRKEGGNLSPS